MIDLADLKIAIRHQLDPSDTTEDAYLASLEAGAVQYVQRWTGRAFGASATGQRFVVPGNGTPLLYLPELASAVTAVSERIYEGGDETAIDAVAADGWTLRIYPGRSMSGELIRKGGGVWSLGYEYVVTANTGYAANSEPEDVRQAVKEIVHHWYDNRAPEGGDLTAIPAGVRDLLAPLKRWTA